MGMRKDRFASVNSHSGALGVRAGPCGGLIPEMNYCCWTLVLVLIESCQNTQFAVMGSLSHRLVRMSTLTPSTYSGHMHIQTRPPTRTRWSGLMNHIFLYIMLTVDFWKYGTTMHYVKKASWQRLFDATFCRETLGPGIHVHVILTRTIYLISVADPFNTPSWWPFSAG